MGFTTIITDPPDSRSRDRRFLKTPNLLFGVGVLIVGHLLAGLLCRCGEQPAWRFLLYGDYRRLRCICERGGTAGSCQWFHWLFYLHSILNHHPILGTN